MMFLGYSPFGLEEFDSSIAIQSVYNMECMNCELDEIKIDENVTELYNSDKDEWGYDTIFQAKFEGNLEAGNIDNKGVPIEYIKFRKREVTTLEWRDIATFPYNSLVKLYEYTDKYVKATEEYEYSVVPLTSNVSGKATTQKIMCDFNDIWLVGKSKQVKLKYDITQGEYENVNQSSIIEPLGGKFPMVYHSELDYLKTNCNVKIISDELVNSGKGSITDKRHERLVREDVLSFLKDKKPKIYKTASGKMLLVSLMNIREKPINELGGVIADVSCDIVEIGDATKQSDLERSGLL